MEKKIAYGNPKLTGLKSTETDKSLSVNVNFPFIVRTDCLMAKSTENLGFGCRILALNYSHSNILVSPI